MLNALAAARRYFHIASAPLLEKIAVAEAAKLFNQIGNPEERDECASVFQAIDQKYPGKICWAIL